MGVNTGSNQRFLRFPWEIQFTNIAMNSMGDDAKLPDDILWAPYVKGAAGKIWIEGLNHILNWKKQGFEVKVNVVRKFGWAGLNWKICNSDFYFKPGIAYSTIGANFSTRARRFKSIFDVSGSSVFPQDVPNAVCLMNSSLAREILSSLNPTVNFQVTDVNRLPLFPIESAAEIFAQLDRAFTQHEAARETSVEFKQPGPSCWTYAQAWAQQAVDRPAGDPLPDWKPTYEAPQPTAHISYAIGIALGRFSANGEGILSNDPQPDERRSSLPAGILYLSAYSGDRPDGPDNLNHSACDPLRTAWEEHGGEIDRKKTLHPWLREKFFKDHLKSYEQRPIYFPLSSENKNFVAYCAIHRWTDTTLQTLIADHLRPDLTLLEGEIADLGSTRSQGTTKDQAAAEKRRNDLLALLQELEAFIRLVQQCAEQGPPQAEPTDTPRETNARYAMNLDDGVMVNSAALWPLLDPQGWKKPKAWWSELCNAKGKKDYDWSHLAARYFPQRVDGKCQTDPSLAVAHGCFWRYHPAKAYEWELRLQDEIAPDFTIDETDSDTCRSQFETNHPDQVAELKEKEEKRRERKRNKEAKDRAEAQLSLTV